MSRTINDFAMMAPMKYYNNEAESQKRTDMIENKDNLYIGSEKHDGDWGMFIHYSNNNNLIRSRSISKVTGAYGDYTAKLPHLCEEMNNWPDNTVVLAEICWDKYGTNANTVGTILRCLAPKAVERQKKEKLVGYMFDCLMVNGEDITEQGYDFRLAAAQDLLALYVPTYFKRTVVFTSDFGAAADSIINAGGEGVVIQLKSNPYMPDTRTAWKTLKLKQKLPSAEYQVVGFIEPNKYYEGELAENWPYRLTDGTLVTKPYFYHWKNGIKILLPSGITSDITSGLTDEDREWLASNEAAEKLAAGEIWAEVKAMSVNDLGKLRHGYLVRLRTTEDGANN